MGWVVKIRVSNSIAGTVKLEESLGRAGGLPIIIIVVLNIAHGSGSILRT
jgi:DNA-binding transcriptional regulator LsrR (DeoR family)